MTSGRRRTRRRNSLLAAVPLMGCLSLLACSEPTRQRVLEFFFDGVPKPGEEKKPPGYAPMGRAPSGPIEEAAAERARAERLMVIHAPYRDNQCNACHNINTGLLFKTTQQGLCQTCHSDVPGAEPFVHGPVAVNECLFCHHPHGSAYPHLLLDEPTPLCLRCHRQTDLGPAPYHSVLSTQSCSECHEAHGGSDRYFLKAGVPLAPEGVPYAPALEAAASQPASQPTADQEDP